MNVASSSWSGFKLPDRIRAAAGALRLTVSIILGLSFVTIQRPRLGRRMPIGQKVISSGGGDRRLHHIGRVDDAVERRLVHQAAFFATMRLFACCGRPSRPF